MSYYEVNCFDPVIGIRLGLGLVSFTTKLKVHFLLLLYKMALNFLGLKCRLMSAEILYAN